MEAGRGSFTSSCRMGLLELMSFVREVLSAKPDGVEVKSINGYAVSMGYLSMAIKGLGFLVLTWTTVVLLGGFVSILPKKDFWSLTFITLAQTAGIFDVNMNEKLGYMKKAYIGLLKASNLTLISSFMEVGEWGLYCYAVLAIILILVQATMLVMILLPLSIIYIFGIFMSGVISLWRLINHDYGGNSDGEASNLAPAMDTLYYLALLQCVLLCYRFLMGRVGKKLCKYMTVGSRHSREVELVLQDYLRETKTGCEKNPAFVEGRNLITYAVDKICSNSPIDCVTGVNIMHTAIRMAEKREQLFQMKRLFFSTSSSRYALQKLLEMLDSRDLHEEKTRSQMSEAELGETYKKLFLQGLSILQVLAANEKNCRVMSDSRDLVSKIMAPITFYLLDHTTYSHGTWSEVVRRSMDVMSQLASAEGETGAKLRHEISSCKEAIKTLWRILSCKKCEPPGLQRRAISVLTRLYVDTTGISGSADFDLLKKENSYCREDFVRMLVNIFTHSKDYSSSIRGYAGEALSNICFLGGITDATIVIQTSSDVVDSLTQVLLHEKNDKCKQAAAEILECLCTHDSKDDEYLHKLKKAILKVIGKILCCGDGTHNGKDIESQCDGKEENNERDKKGEEFQVDALSHMPLNLLSSLLSLCGTVYDMRLIVDLHPQLDESSFLNKIKEILVKKDNPTIENLALCKAIGKMVISMLKYYSGGFFKLEDFGSLIETLSSASQNMLDLDYSVVCSSTSSSETRSKLDERTLVSLVREAKELLAMVPPSTSSSG